MAATKSERIEVRVAHESREHLRDAAESVHEDVSEFVRKAALARADKVLAMSRLTLMPEDQFDAMIESLDAPDPAPYLHSVAQRPRGFVRR